MSGYRDVTFTTSTVSSGGGGSALGSGVFRSDISDGDHQETMRFVDDNDRRPVEKHELNLGKVCLVAGLVLFVTTVFMVSVSLLTDGSSSNSTNFTNLTM